MQCALDHKILFFSKHQWEFLINKRSNANMVLADSDVYNHRKLEIFDIYDCKAEKKLSKIESKEIIIKQSDELLSLSETQKSMSF